MHHHAIKVRTAAKSQGCVTIFISLLPSVCAQVSTNQYRCISTYRKYTQTRVYAPLTEANLYDGISQMGKNLIW